MKRKNIERAYLTVPPYGYPPASPRPKEIFETDEAWKQAYRIYAESLVAWLDRRQKHLVDELWALKWWQFRKKRRLQGLLEDKGFYENL